MRQAHLASLLMLLATEHATAQCELVELAPSQPVDDGAFGSFVDLDGDRAIVGQPVYIGFGESADVFVRSGSTWVHDARLTPPGQELDVSFGSVVAIEGDVAVVSARLDDQAGPDFGAVHVFERSAGSWSWTTKLLPSPPIPGNDGDFGRELSVAGGSILIGAPNEATLVPGDGTGVVYVFEKIGVWTETQRLSGPDLAPTNYEKFGRRFAVDGDCLAVATPYRVASNHSWQIRVYERAGPGQPYALLDLIDAPVDVKYSFDVDVGLDGDDLIVGAREVSSGGHVYFYRLLAGAWTLLDSIESKDLNPGNNAWFGRSVDVENGLALVSDPTPFNVEPGFLSGSSHLFVFDGTNWVHRGRLRAADGVADWFALELALDGGQAIFGAHEHAHVPGGPEDGAAYIFDMTVVPTVYCTGKLNNLGCAAVLDWHGIASATNPQPFRIDASTILSNKPGLFFYGTSGRANLPFLGGTLCALPPLSRTPPQASGGIGPPDTCTGTFAFDLNERIQNGVDPDLVPGVTVAGQFWSRDPDQLDGTGVHLTEAIEATICP